MRRPWTSAPGSAARRPGGPARCLAERYACRLTAVELQPEPHRLSEELTTLCGLSERVGPHGESLAGRLMRFYGAVGELFAGGGVGGVRISGRRG